jgi:hypothetical protein
MQNAITFSAIGFMLAGCVATEPLSPETVMPNGAVSLPSGKGLVWMPFAWTVLINQPKSETLGDPLETLQLRTVGLVLRNQATKAEIFIKLLAQESGGSNNAILDNSKSHVTFFAPLFFELPEGEFSLEAVRNFVIDPATQRPLPMDIAIPNPASGGEKRPITFISRSGRVSAISRFAMQTTFGKKNTVTDFERIEKDSIPVDFVLQHLKRPVSDASLISAASPDFPRLRLSLTDPSGAPKSPEDPVARVGLLLDLPCETDGVMKLVWKRSADEREFMSFINLGMKGDVQCQKTKTLHPTVMFPKGDWALKSTFILPSKLEKLPLKNFVFKKPSEFAESYFALGKQNLPFESFASEREITRQIAVRLSAAGSQASNAAPDLKSKVLYLGRFELVAQQGSKPTEGAPVNWDTLFKRNYSIPDLRKHFDASDISNAYTLEKLSRDRSKGTVQSILKVSSLASEVKKVESSSVEFRKSSTEMLAQCLTEREEFDPLVNVQGQLHFSALKGANSITVKKLEFGNEGPSAGWVRECFQKKILGFRFTGKVPGSFQGELNFATE